ncbi:MAG TPA: serine hydrolase [Blastocatellia bacterium]|nr:serine hydrolase [Blastocatellia bacterium]
MSHRINRCLSILLLLILAAYPVNPQSKQVSPSPAYWPTHGWRTTTPEAQGIDSDKLAEAIEQARGGGVNIHSLLIVRNGYLVAEAYFHPYDGKSPHDLASVTKSITTTLVGLAIEQGKIRSVGQPALSFFPGHMIANRDERKERITVEHLLTMSSCLDCKSKGGEPTLWDMHQEKNWAQFMLDLPMVGEPGSNFVYCSGGMHLLSTIISQTTGMTAHDYAKQRLFGALGIRETIWPADPQGTSHGFGNLHLFPRDMAKIGWLFLNQGRWDGKQVVPAEWVATATRRHIKTGNPRDYGYGWWIHPEGSVIPFEASGRGGQQISVVPSKNAVIVFNGGGFAAGEIMKLVIPAFKSDQPLPENPAGVARLKAAIAAAGKAPAPNAMPALPEMAKTISGKTYVLEPNWISLQALSLTFTPSGDATARLTFGASQNLGWTQKHTEARAVGLDGITRVSPGGRLGLPAGVRGAWEDDHTFTLEYDEIANINGYRLTITFSGDGVSIHAKERTGLFDEKFAGKVEPRP